MEPTNPNANTFEKLHMSKPSACKIDILFHVTVFYLVQLANV